MNYVCLNCGSINKQNKSNICLSCSAVTNINEYRKLSKYSKNVVHYGYNYRVFYEEQLKKSGAIRKKASLINPTTYYEWLAVAVLGGVIGNFSYDILKQVVSQITESIKSKKQKTSLNTKEEELLLILSNKKELKKFEKYIIAYYKDFPRLNPLIKNVISEEEIADFIGFRYSKYLKNKPNINDKDRFDGFKKIFKQALAIQETKNKKKPKIEVSKLITKTKFASRKKTAKK